MVTHRDHLQRLARLLAEPWEATTIELEARDFFAKLINAAILAPIDKPRLACPPICPNCVQNPIRPRSPYCSETCKEQAALVRQVRAHLLVEAIDDPARQVALGQVAWHVLGGGYPLRTSKVEPKPLAKVLARNEGRCEVCGAPATTVDHPRTACNRPINLRAVCADCCSDQPFGSPKIVSRSAYRHLFEELATRLSAETPLRICDHAETWDWREYLSRSR
jgi:hypothetical protein